MQCNRGRILTEIRYIESAGVPRVSEYISVRRSMCVQLHCKSKVCFISYNCRQRADLIFELKDFKALYQR